MASEFYQIQNDSAMEMEWSDEFNYSPISDYSPTSGYSPTSAYSPSSNRSSSMESEDSEEIKSFEVLDNEPEIIIIDLTSDDEDIKKPTVECPRCCEQFPSTSSLRQHVKDEHTMTKSFTCDLCDCKFFFKYNLVRHIKKSHIYPEDVRPYKTKLRVLRQKTRVFTFKHLS